MANRDNHYEAAFEEYLRSRRVPYVAVDEARRSSGRVLVAQEPRLHRLRPSGHTWLVDVKGRRFPSGEQKQYWKNWSTRDDLVSLACWEKLFGDRFRGLFVFAYDVLGDRSPLPAEQLFVHQGSLYGFVAIRLAQYVVHARQISPKWDTVAMPVERFRELAEPIETLL